MSDTLDLYDSFTSAEGPNSGGGKSDISTLKDREIIIPSVRVRGFEGVSWELCPSPLAEFEFNLQLAVSA